VVVFVSSNITARLTSGVLQRARKAPVRSFLQLVFHAHLVFPDEIVELRCFLVHEHGGSLQIFDEGFFVQSGQLLNQHLIEPLLRFGLGSFVKENKIFT